MKNNYHLFFTNLANELKIDVILSLKKSKKSVTELMKDLHVEQSKLSHALNNLRRCRIVEVEKHGKKRIYSLNKETIMPILELIDKHSFCHCGKKCQGCV